MAPPPPAADDDDLSFVLDLCLLPFFFLRGREGEGVRKREGRREGGRELHGVKEMDLQWIDLLKNLLEKAFLLRFLCCWVLSEANCSQITWESWN